MTEEEIYNEALLNSNEYFAFKNIYLNTKFFKNLQENLFKQHTRCSNCGTNEDLTIHFFDYKYLFNPIYGKNCIVLCKNCQKETISKLKAVQKIEHSEKRNVRKRYKNRYDKYKKQKLELEKKLREQEEKQVQKSSKMKRDIAKSRSEQKKHLSISERIENKEKELIFKSKHE